MISLDTVLVLITEHNIAICPSDGKSPGVTREIRVRIPLLSPYSIMTNKSDCYYLQDNGKCSRDEEYLKYCYLGSHGVRIKYCDYYATEREHNLRKVKDRINEKDH